MHPGFKDFWRFNYFILSNDEIFGISKVVSAHVLSGNRVLPANKWKLRPILLATRSLSSPPGQLCALRPICEARLP